MYSCNYKKNSISFGTALLSDCWLLTNPSKIPFTPNQLSKMSCFLLFTELKRRQVALMPHCPTGTSRPALGGGEASAVVRWGAACEDDICILEVFPSYTSILGLAINEIYLVVIFNPWHISIANTVTSLSYDRVHRIANKIFSGVPQVSLGRRRRQQEGEGEITCSLFCWSGG